MDGDELLDEWIQRIDHDLSLRGIPASKRPIFSANQLIKSALDAPEEVLTASSVFFDIYRRVLKWYKRIYGNSVLSQKEISNFRTFVLIRSIPYEVSIPRIFTKPDRNPKRTWLIFCERTYPGENSMSYILDQTILSAFDINSKQQLKRLIDGRVRAYRRIYKSLLLCQKNSEKPGLIKDIIRHIEQASDGIVRGQDREFSVPIWEMFFAVEKCTKLLISDYSNDVPNVHKLVALFKKLPDEISKMLLSTHFFTRFPHLKAIEFRYSEETESDIRIVSRYFDYTLEFLVLATSKLKSNIHGKNMKFLIRNDLLNAVE